MTAHDRKKIIKTYEKEADRCARRAFKLMTAAENYLLKAKHEKAALEAV